MNIELKFMNFLSQPEQSVCHIRNQLECQNNRKEKKEQMNSIQLYNL